jgi:hypothetical protein
MQNLFDIFSTRELSILIWISIALIFAMISKGIRDGLFGVLKLIFEKTIGLILLLFTIYICAITFLLYKVHLWDLSLLKDSLFWFLTVAIVLFFTINKAKDDRYFKNLLKENIKWTILIEFVVNFYTFSLPIELIFVPLMIFLGMIQGYAQTDNKYSQVNRFMHYIFSFIGWILLIFVTYKTFKDYQHLFSIKTLFAFLLPLILTFLVIPVLYLLAVYMNYEELFIRINFMTNNNEIKRKLLKRQIIFTARFNLNRLLIISKGVNKFDIFHSDNMKSYIKKIK